LHGILFLFAQSILVILFLLLTYYMCIYLTYGTNKIDKQTSSAMTVSFSITLQSLLLSKRDLQYSENLVNQGCSNRMLLKASFLFRNFFYNTPSNASHSACYRPAAAILSNSFSKYATWLLLCYLLIINYQLLIHPAFLFPTCTNPIIHLFYPPNICIGIVLDCSWDIFMSQEKLQTMIMQTFFLKGGGGGVKRGALWDLCK